MKVHVVPRRDLPLVDVEIVFQPGASLDAGETAGRVQMMCEMMDEGTKTRSAQQVAEDVEYLGGYFDINPTHDTIVVSTHVQSRQLQNALELMSDVVLNPVFDAAEFNRKRGEQVRALRQELDDADVMAAHAVIAGVFSEDHPYGVPIAGKAAALERLTRDELAKLHGELCRTSNAFAVVVGDVDETQIINELRVYFPDIEAANEQRPRLAQPVNRERRVLLVDKPGAAQAELRAGHTAPPRDTDDYFAIIVLNAILGGSFTSRLNTILRERMGVTYGASSRFRLRKDGGIFSTGAAVFTEAAARSAQVVVEEMTRLQTDKVGADELLRAQRYIALGLPRSFETTTDIAAHVREQVVHGLADDYWTTFVERTMSVTADDVRASAQRHLAPDSLTIAIAADATSVRPALESAGLGDVIMTQVEA